MSVVSKTAETNTVSLYFVSALAGPRIGKVRVAKGDKLHMTEHQARALLLSGELVDDKDKVDDPFGEAERTASAKAAKEAADKEAAEAKALADKAAADAKALADKAAAEAKAAADKAASDAKAAAEKAKSNAKPGDAATPSVAS